MALLVAALQIAMVGYVPGAVLFRLPWADRQRRAALCAEERAFWAVILSVSVSMAVVLALGAAGVYTLGRLLTVNAAIVLVALIACRGRLRLDHAARPTAAALLPLTLIGLGGWLYFPTAEYVMGGKDPGVYISEGIQIALRGTLSINDTLVASIPGPFRDLFFRQLSGVPYYGTRFMGFYLNDPGTGEVVGQFPHLFPASIAVAYDIAGLDAARAVVALWTILGLVAVYFVAARLVGRLPAAAGCGLLAINVIEVWYGRYPNAEVALQAMLMAIVLAVDRALVDRDRFFEFVAGSLLGLVLFLRIESVLGLAAVLGAVALMSLRGRQMSWRFFTPLAASCALGTWYMLDLLSGYSASLVRFLAKLGPTLSVLGLLAALAAVLLMSRVRVTGVAARALDFLPMLVAVTVVALAGYAYFLRHPEPPLAPHDAHALRTFAWYVTGPGIAAAVAGMAIVLPRLFWTSPAFFSTAVTFSVFVFYKIRIIPEHFWMTRRFMPVVLPATLVMIAALASSCIDPDGPVSQWLQWLFPEARGTVARRWRRRFQFAIASVAVGLTMALGATFWRAAAPIRDHVEYRGMIGHLSRLLAQSGPRDLLLFEARRASDMHVLALPLAYIHGRNVLVLASRTVDTELLAGFLAWALNQFEHVYYLGRGQPLLSRHLGVAQLWRDVFWVPEYESLPNAYPTKVKLKEFRFEQCRLAIGDEARRLRLQPLVPLDDVHLVNFHDLERDRRGEWRWSRGVSDALLTSIDAETTAVSISMENGGRPASAPPAVVEVTLAGRLLGRAAVGEGARPYLFAVPRDLALEAAASGAPVTLRLTVSTWTPKQILGTADDRELGVMVSRIEVSRSPLAARPGVSSPERNN